MGFSPPQPPQVAQPPQPLAPPTPPPSPFPARANDSEPEVARAVMKRLSKLMFDPRYDAQPKEWRSQVDDKYNAARTVMAALAPLPALPKGVSIVGKPSDAASLQAEAQAAMGKSPAAQAAQIAPPSPSVGPSNPMPKMPGLAP